MKRFLTLTLALSFAATLAAQTNRAITVDVHEGVNVVMAL